MDWADELTAQLSGPQVLNDSKTPSGTVHVGSLRGPVIDDVIVRALRARGLAASFLYGIDDLDPMDAQAALTPDAVAREMGRPLAHVPDQAGDGHASYAQHHASAFIDTFATLGIVPDRYYAMSELYGQGLLDPYLRTALDRVEVVRAIYRTLAGQASGKVAPRREQPADWHPVSVICEVCGKVGTTIVTRWDGALVYYECQADLVTWAQGCGHSGWTSPFGGRAKLTWNLEWAAQWSLFAVTIEPAGKDLSSAGGSRDRSEAIAREVFERLPPINLPYEFLTTGGAKMASSAGRGAPAHVMAAVLPPEVLRFLFVRTRPNTSLEFSPEGTDAIPRLFDEFDRVAAATAGQPVKGILPPDPGHLFAQASLSLDPVILAAQAAAFRLPFGQIAFLIQQPDIDLASAAMAEKGEPLTSPETNLLAKRADSAQAWLDAYAPAEARIAVRRDGLPPEAVDLDAPERAFLGSLASRAAAPDAPSDGAAWQALIFETARAADLPGGRAFAALYLAFLGRSSGPRAGWLLAGLDRGFVIARLREAATSDDEVALGKL